MRLEKVCKSYEDTVVLKDFSIEFPEKKITCILGKSGCGKTTLLNAICGLEKIDSGKIVFENESPSFSYLFQEPRLMPWLTVLENVSVTLGQDDEKAKYYLSMVGLEDSLNKFPADLSGGMRQRVSMARAFAKNADIILMDEPFQSLDLALHDSLRKQFLELWEKSKSTVLWVTHDISEACLSADRIVCLASRPVETKLAFDIAPLRRGDNLENMGEIMAKLYQTLTT